MTPLFGRIVKELTLPLKRRTFNDQCGLLKRLDDVHGFEVSAVMEAALALCERVRDQGRSMLDVTSDCLAFLPAPRTWIEWRHGDGSRQAVLLDVDADGEFARAFWAVISSDARIFMSQGRDRDFVLMLGAGSLREMRHADKAYAVRHLPGETEAQAKGWTMLVYALLAIINTPKIIGRRTHQPHRGLEKKLIAKRALVGKFPLHAWTEIVLEIAPPLDASGAPSREAHFTGERALHFVRAHLRICDGKIVYVSAHWKGNPALGIVRSRYKLRMPEQGRNSPCETPGPSP